MKSVLKLENIHFTFEKRSIAALESISLELGEGETLVLLGPSGTGKSTLFSLIQKSREPLKGEITLDKSVGEPALFESLSDIDSDENLETLLNKKLSHLTPDQAHAEIHSMLDLLGLQYKEKRKLNELSQGQVTRALFACTLIKRPKLVLLDEPLSHLDPILKMELISEYKDIAKSLGISSFWITHDPNEALRIGDRLAYLSHGKLAQVGTPIDFLLSPTNLEIARFFGPLSFFVATKISSTRLKTSFSEFEVEESKIAHLGERLVVGVRPRSLELSENGEFKAKYDKISVTPEGIELEIVGLDKNPIRALVSGMPSKRWIQFSIKWSEALFFAL